MYIVIRNITRFLLVILFQVLVMDNVMINGYMIPQVYLLFILLMPFETPRWVQLISGFLLGMGIDRLPESYGPVTEPRRLDTCTGAPCAPIWPPSLPAAGPKSQM